MSATAVTFFEWYVRAHPTYSWLRCFVVAVPGIFVVNIAIWNLIHLNGIIGATIVHNLMTNGIRIVVTLVLLGEVVSTGTWIAFCLLVAANLVKGFWR